MSRFDLIVIGAGSGGVRASRVAARLGAKVAVVEAGPLGGTCVNAGCVPKKLLAYAAELGEGMADAVGFGWEKAPRRHSWNRLIAAKNRELRRLNGLYEGILSEAGVEVIRGRATLETADTVVVGEQRLEAAHILLATGSVPQIPDFPGAELALTSQQALEMSELPRRIVVFGGGYIAVEFAAIFNALGAETTLVYRGPLFLRGFDDDMRHALAEEMSARGVKLIWDTKLEELAKRAIGLQLKLSNGRSGAIDAVLLATGRVPNTRGLGLEKIGVELGPRNGVVVDDRYRSSVPQISAVGDCIDRVMLTPVALAEGSFVAQQLFGQPAFTLDYERVPTAVFAQPQLATVGLTEQQARERLGRVRVYRSRFKPLRNTLSGRDSKTLMKLVVDHATDRVVGIHMVGPDAAEIVQGLAVAMTAGATKEDFNRTLGIHPTSAEEFVTMREPAVE